MLHKEVIHPGDGKTGNAPPQNANTANDTPAHPTLSLNEGIGDKGPALHFTPHNALLRLRMRFPNLQVIPVPNSTRTRILAANIAEDMSLPDGTLAVLFFATAPFWANFDGQARLPVADGEGQSLFIPTNFPYMLYVMGKAQISVFAEQATTVQAFCFIDIPVERT